jgi:protein-arginine kinase activator protein McsA
MWREAHCAARFPALICKAIGAQFIEENLIALFEFETAARLRDQIKELQA